MNAKQMKDAVTRGVTIHWKDYNHDIIQTNGGEYKIRRIDKGIYIDLTWSDGETLNGKYNDFFTAGRKAKTVIPHTTCYHITFNNGSMYNVRKDIHLTKYLLTNAMPVLPTLQNEFFTEYVRARINDGITNKEYFDDIIKSREI